MDKHINPAATVPANKVDKDHVLRLAALRQAQGYVGQQEEPKGSNWGPFVKRCLELVNIGHPAPWCMAVMYRAFHEASILCGFPNICERTGHVLTFWNRSKERQILKKDSTDKNILPGYLGVMDFGKNKGHVYMVERVEGRKVFTLEGNTNDEGSREGYEFCRRERSLDDRLLKGFVKF